MQRIQPFESRFGRSRWHGISLSEGLIAIIGYAMMHYLWSGTPRVGVFGACAVVNEPLDMGTVSMGETEPCVAELQQDQEARRTCAR